MSVVVRNEELRTVRDAMRTLNRMVESLDQGDIEKFVLMRGSKMCAVILSFEDYADLLARKDRNEPA